MENIRRQIWIYILIAIVYGAGLDFVADFFQDDIRHGFYIVLEIFARLSYTIAVGLFVAAYVTTRITQASAAKDKERLDAIQAAINADVFDSLFKSLTPPDLFDAFKEDILRKKILVQEAEWDLCFTEEQAGEVKLIQIIEYTMENLSKEQLIEPMVITVVDSPDSRLSLLSAYGKVNGDEWEYQKNGGLPDNMRIEALEVEKGDGERIQINLEIPARGSVKLRLEFEAIYPERVNDVYFTKYPITSGRIDATFPPEYEFGVFPSMSGRMILEYARQDKSKWKLEGVALPKQGFAFYLKKKSQL